MRSSDRISRANHLAVERIVNSNTALVAVEKALDVIPGMKEDLFLHSGPPIDWHKMCGPVRGAVLGAIVYEGLATNLEEAEQVVNSGKIIFSPTHHHSAVAPMAGIISPSMPVYVVRNKTYDNDSYCNVNEGVGKVKTLRFGANNDEVLSRLKWIERILAPALKSVLVINGEINLRDIIAESLRRGDECHNRNKSATSSFMQLIIKPLLESSLDKSTIASILDFINGNPHFFLNLSMASSKATMDSAKNIEYSTVVTVMATNGVDFGIQVSGLSDEWFTAPAPKQARGKIFDGYSPEDANPVFGDSYISEPAGVGAFAMAASPAIAEFVGGTPSYGTKITKLMSKIAVARHTVYKIPYLDFAGTPVGIDIRKVLKTSIVPIVNTGLAHKNPGVGQIGAGIAYAPMECFKKAAKAYKLKYQVRLK
jgi:hypothetical protein